MDLEGRSRSDNARREREEEKKLTRGEEMKRRGKKRMEKK